MFPDFGLLWFASEHSHHVSCLARFVCFLSFFDLRVYFAYTRSKPVCLKALVPPCLVLLSLSERNLHRLKVTGVVA